MKTMMQIIVTILALTVFILGRAETVNSKELNCLAKNIYYEAGNESIEGKVAVGVVTLNRVADGRFSNSVCGVVHQRTVFHHQRHTTVTHEIHTKKYLVLDQVEQVTEVKTHVYSTAVCQFSWSCRAVASPKIDDQRWEESLSVATQLLQGGFDDLRAKYDQALYFHAVTIRPAWQNLKKRVAHIGGHIFYAEK
jgi:spore germination cell wall hydrolase CwlJ-like protein